MDRDIDKASALVISSSSTTRSILCTQLRELGVGQIRQTGRVTEARTILERYAADIVLCEDEFDDAPMSGHDLLAELRREDLLPYSTVFIMVTGRATYAKVVEAAESALDSVLVKPYTAAALLERLREARRRKRTLKPVFEAIALGRPEQAIELCLERFRQGQDYDMFCARVAAELMLRGQRPDRAQALFEQVQAKRSQPWAQLGLARARLAAGDMPGARRLAEPLMAQGSIAADACDVLVRVQIEQGEFAIALETSRRAVTLTPGCLLRLQHCGALAFHQGDPKEALAMLDRAIAMGVQSTLLEPVTLWLVALMRADQRDSKSLSAVQAHIRRAQERQPGSARLRRLVAACDVLSAVVSRTDAAATAGLRSLMAEVSNDDFDLDAATVLLHLLARLPDAVPAEELKESLRLLGLRHCGTRVATEALVGAAGQLPGAEALLRECHAQIHGVAEQALDHSLRGDPGKAAQSLLDEGDRTRNARLIEMAQQVLRRHAAAIGDTALMSQRAGTLQQRFCIPVSHIAGIRRGGRSPGGLAMRA